LDTSELEAAYRSVLDLAAASPGPGLPAAGDVQAWGPDDVLAHLIVNDRLLIRAVRSVLEDAARPYDNADAVELAELRALGKELGGTNGLIGELGASSRELLDLAGLLAIQARRHLPMHEAQLGELLGGPGLP
jgi:hypothetical protein